MVGISRLNDNVRANQGIGGLLNRELILSADGDQAAIAIVTTGDDNDNNVGLLNIIYRHVFQDNDNLWQFNTCKKSFDNAEDCELCQEGISRQQRFAFWAWVYTQIKKNRPDQNSQLWEEVKTRTGTMYQMPICAFRVVSFPVGKSHMYWNELVDIYNEQGSLNKLAMRIGRNGAGRDTTWKMSLTNNDVNWNEIRKESDETVEDLPSILDYYKEQDVRREEFKRVPLSDNDNKVNSSNDSEDNFDGDDIIDNMF